MSLHHPQLFWDFVPSILFFLYLLSPLALSYWFLKYPSLFHLKKKPTTVKYKIFLPLHFSLQESSYIPLPVNDKNINSVPTSSTPLQASHHDSLFIHSSYTNNLVVVDPMGTLQGFFYLAFLYTQYIHSAETHSSLRLQGLRTSHDSSYTSAYPFLRPFIDSLLLTSQMTECFGIHF